jgi:NADH-quinone oxidoreductase subunit C
MSDHLQTTVAALQDKFGLEAISFREKPSLIVPPDAIVSVTETLRDTYQFEVLSSLSAVDYWPEQDPRFHVVYQILSVEHAVRLALRVPVGGDDPMVPTIEGTYPNANWFEREVFDMFGIRFEGHSDMRRILMPHDWEGHPLRKDYPLGYEEVQFTFNFDEIDLRKPYAKE